MDYPFVESLMKLLDSFDRAVERMSVEERPTASTQKYARDLLVELHGRLYRKFEPPHISFDLDSDDTPAVVLQWWTEQRILTVYVLESEVTYCKAWRESTGWKMSDGSSTDHADLLNLLQWLKEE